MKVFGRIVRTKRGTRINDVRGVTFGEFDWNEKVTVIDRSIKIPDNVSVVIFDTDDVIFAKTVNIIKKCIFDWVTFSIKQIEDVEIWRFRHSNVSCPEIEEGFSDTPIKTEVTYFIDRNGGWFIRKHTYKVIDTDIFNDIVTNHSVEEKPSDWSKIDHYDSIQW